MSKRMLKRATSLSILKNHHLNKHLLSFEVSKSIQNQIIYYLLLFIFNFKNKVMGFWGFGVLGFYEAQVQCRSAS